MPSWSIVIGGEDMRVIGGATVAADASGEAAHPVPVNKDELSEAMLLYRLGDPDFTFGHVEGARYDLGHSMHTGVPFGRPDYIADHHWIALMRQIDQMLLHHYRGHIIGEADTPGSSS